MSKNNKNNKEAKNAKEAMAGALKAKPTQQGKLSTPL